MGIENFIPHDSSAIVFLNVKVNVPIMDTLANFESDKADHVKFIHEVFNVYLQNILTKLDTPLYGGFTNTPYFGGPVGEHHLEDTRIRINFDTAKDLLNIYDDYLRQDYVPDSASISDVYSLAESYGKNSHYARALLLLLHDVRIGYDDVTKLLPRSEQKSATRSVKKESAFYPNPTNNILYRNTEVTLVSDMVLYSLDGRVLGVYDKKQERIDLSYQIEGIYFLQYQTSEGLKVHKIIKN